MAIRFPILFPAALLALVLVALAGVLWGTAEISWADRAAILMREDDVPRGLSLIIWQWRIPRVLAVGVIGAGLALAGALMQTALRNPMADPYLMGLSSGASAAAVGAIIWLPSWITDSFGVPAIAFMGAALAFVMTLGLSSRRGEPLDPLVVILAGVAVSLMFQSLTAFFLYLGDPQAVRSALGWLMGTAANTEWHELPLITLALLLIAGWALLNANALDATLLGEERAQALGVHTGRLRMWIFLATVTLTGLAVSVAGIVGFIGLIIPHMARLLTGARHRVLLPLTLVLGALVLIAVDLLCRTLLAPEELPLGVLLALFAAPPFIMILRGLRRAS
ncbi:iron complex transport system permease protein [Aliiroseovarius halocynthiae]|uniref:Iron ABC transporter permease n=1 Tax=Aliiroseovarius halocynthiae TaxID=985055 RepID=A0A545SLM8_9RHOB|nr:iron ABC transporter permease [Aliiroseovarius halocynthiae]TQV65878.1 iron ABC transporter permease [Aliiroseovarius halocynthiae]SMR83492.1 iron complex transport system permease protein [Aliiroseovarius halocynthiae]